MKPNEIIPVIVSIVVIILVAVLQKFSKLFAAVTATMPLGIPLAFWIVYSATDGDQQQVEGFTQDLITGAIPTLGFTIALWLGARQGLKIIPLLLLSYVAWGIILLVVIGIRRLLGV